MTFDELYAEKQKENSVLNSWQLNGKLVLNDREVKKKSNITCVIVYMKTVN